MNLPLFPLKASPDTFNDRFYFSLNPAVRRLRTVVDWGLRIRMAGSLRAMGFFVDTDIVELGTDPDIAMKQRLIMGVNQEGAPAPSLDPKAFTRFADLIVLSEAQPFGDRNRVSGDPNGIGDVYNNYLDRSPVGAVWADKKTGKVYEKVYMATEAAFPEMTANELEDVNGDLLAVWVQIPLDASIAADLATVK